MNIKTWQEVSKQFSLDRRAMATNQMIWMQQEIDELRAAYEAQAKRANALALVVNDLTKIVTHSVETKDQFIERVKGILSVDPDLRVSEMQVDYEALSGKYHELKARSEIDARTVEALQKENGLLENKVELLKEDLDCIHISLDKAGIPRKHSEGNVYSIWGRVVAHSEVLKAENAAQAKRINEFESKCQESFVVSAKKNLVIFGSKESIHAMNGLALEAMELRESNAAQAKRITELERSENQFVELRKVDDAACAGYVKEIESLRKQSEEMLTAMRRAVLALAFAAESSKAMQDDYQALSNAIDKAVSAQKGTEWAATQQKLNHRQEANMSNGRKSGT